MPVEGPFIVVATHRSHLDPPALSLITKRHLRFLAKRELFATSVGGWMITSLGAVPVDRSKSDIGAIRSCMEIIRAGEGLVIFPEGTRREGPDVKDLERGATLLAERTNTPLVPVAIAGTERALGKGSNRMRRSKIQVRVGNVLPPNTPLESIRTELESLYRDANAAV